MLKTHREVNRVDSAVNSTSAGIHLIWNWILCIECIGTVPWEVRWYVHLWKVYVKGPIHSKLNFAVLPLKKTAQKLNRMFSGTAQVSYQVCQVFFFVSGLCVFLCV